MDCAVTAIYRSHAMAHLVRNELERAGIGRDRITVLPGARIVSNDAEAHASATTPDNIEDALRRLEDLPLPESDARTCRQALRRGGYMVSVSLGDEADLDRVQEVMERQEEVLSLDQLDGTHLDAAADLTASRSIAMPVGGL